MLNMLQFIERHFECSNWEWREAFQKDKQFCSAPTFDKAVNELNPRSLIVRYCDISPVLSSHFPRKITLILNKFKTYDHFSLTGSLNNEDEFWSVNL
jgi:hypothetical protein